MLAWICVSLCCHEQTYRLVFGGKQAGWAAHVGGLPEWRLESLSQVRQCSSLLLEGPIAFPALFSEPA